MKRPPSRPAKSGFLGVVTLRHARDYYVDENKRREYLEAMERYREWQRREA